MEQLHPHTTQESPTEEKSRPKLKKEPSSNSVNISAIARKVFSGLPNVGLYPHEIEEIINTILSEIKSTIKEGRKVEIRGFGSFRPRKYKGKVTSVNFRSFLKE